MSNGRYAMQLISRYIRRMPKDITCHQFCLGATRVIRESYLPLLSSLRSDKSQQILQQLYDHPEERLCASVVIYSRLRREVWLVGDCHCLINGQYFDNPKPYEQELAEMRAARVVELLASGVKPAALLQASDPAREAMIPRSDGYPFLQSTLKDSEQRLQQQRESDPLNIGSFKATKAFVAGSNSFDDRTYIRFTD